MHEFLRPPSGRTEVSKARGGCLGAGWRGRTRQPAISPGELDVSLDPGISEWGNPTSTRSSPHGEHIAVRGQPGEPKHRSTRRRRKRDRFGFGRRWRVAGATGKRIECRAEGGESPVPVAPSRAADSGVGRDTRNPVRRRGDRPARLNTVRLPIANEYR